MSLLRVKLDRFHHFSRPSPRFCPLHRRRFYSALHCRFILGLCYGRRVGPSRAQGDDQRQQGRNDEICHVHRIGKGNETTFLRIFIIFKHFSRRSATLSKTAFSIMTLSIITLSTMTFTLMTLGKMTFSIMTLPLPKIL